MAFEEGRTSGAAERTSGGKAAKHVAGAKNFLEIWCPGEDSNLHTVASTST